MSRTILPKDVRDFFVQQGSIGGKIGGKKRMGKLTPEERSQLARKAVAARIKKAALGPPDNAVDS